METTWAFYYWLYTSIARIANVVEFISMLVALFASIGVAFVYFYHSVDGDVEILRYARKLSIAVIVSVALLLITALIPSRDDMRTILALIGVETAVKSERAGRLAEKSLRVIEQQLDALEKQEVGK